MVAALKLGDERVGGACSFADLVLGEVELVATLSDVRCDPVALPEGADRGVLVAGLPVLLAPPSPRSGRRWWLGALRGRVVPSTRRS